MNPGQEKSIELIKNQFIEILKESFGDDLLSVMLYGSILGDNFVKGVSDINVLIILKNANPERILKFGKKAHRLIKKNNITPLILTRQEFINSADVFPLEYIDIKERNLVIYGINETENLKLTNKNLRHQIEAGLRGNLARLRQAMIASKGSTAVLKRFFGMWLGSVLTMFRGLIRLKKEAASPISSISSMNNAEVIERVGTLYDIDTTVFKDLMNLREKLKKSDLKGIAMEIHDKLSTLIRAVDKLELD